METGDYLRRAVAQFDDNGNWSGTSFGNGHLDEKTLAVSGHGKLIADRIDSQFGVEEWSRNPRFDRGVYTNITAINLPSRAR